MNLPNTANDVQARSKFLMRLRRRRTPPQNCRNRSLNLARESAPSAGRAPLQPLTSWPPLRLRRQNPTHRDWRRRALAPSEAAVARTIASPMPPRDWCGGHAASMRCCRCSTSAASRPAPSRRRSPRWALAPRASVHRICRVLDVDLELGGENIREASTSC